MLAPGGTSASEPSQSQAERPVDVAATAPAPVVTAATLENDPREDPRHDVDLEATAARDEAYLQRLRSRYGRALAERRRLDKEERARRSSQGPATGPEAAGAVKAALPTDEARPESVCADNTAQSSGECRDDEGRGEKAGGSSLAAAVSGRIYVDLLLAMEGHHGADRDPDEEFNDADDSYSDLDGMFALDGDDSDSDSDSSADDTDSGSPGGRHKEDLWWRLGLGAADAAAAGGDEDDSSDASYREVDGAASASTDDDSTDGAEEEDGEALRNELAESDDEEGSTTAVDGALTQPGDKTSRFADGTGLIWHTISGFSQHPIGGSRFDRVRAHRICHHNRGC